MKITLIFGFTYTSFTFSLTSIGTLKNIRNSRGKFVRWILELESIDYVLLFSRQKCSQDFFIRPTPFREKPVAENSNQPPSPPTENGDCPVTGYDETKVETSETAPGSVEELFIH